MKVSMPIHGPTISEITDREDLLTIVRAEQSISHDPEDIEGYTAYQVKMRTSIYMNAVLAEESHRHDKEIKIYNYIHDQIRSIQHETLIAHFDVSKRETLVEFHDMLASWLLEDTQKDDLTEGDIQKLKVRLESIFMRFNNETEGEKINELLKNLWISLNNNSPRNKFNA